MYSNEKRADDRRSTQCTNAMVTIATSRERSSSLIRQLHVAGGDFIVASGEVTFLGEDGLPRGRGHYMVVISQHDKEQLLTDLRLAFNWRQPRDSATVNAIDSTAAPPAANLPTESRGIRQEAERITQRTKPNPRHSKRVRCLPTSRRCRREHLPGCGRHLRELRNRGGSRRVSVTRGTVRGNVAILDGVLLSAGQWAFRFANRLLHGRLWEIRGPVAFRCSIQSCTVGAAL